MVTTSRSIALGLCWAWWQAATFTQASWFDMVPNSYICRIAHIAYSLTNSPPYGRSN